MLKNISLKELRPKLPSLIKDVDSKMDRYIITKRGRPVALMMAIDDYDSLIETLEILSDKKLAARIKRAEAEIKRGIFVPFEVTKKDKGVV